MRKFVVPPERADHIPLHDMGRRCRGYMLLLQERDALTLREGAVPDGVHAIVHRSADRPHERTRSLQQLQIAAGRSLGAAEPLHNIRDSDAPLVLEHVQNSFSAAIPFVKLKLLGHSFNAPPMSNCSSRCTAAPQSGRASQSPLP